MLFNRTVFISGAVAFVLAAIAATAILSGANAGDKPKPKDNGGSGAFYSRLGF